MLTGCSISRGTSLARTAARSLQVPIGRYVILKVTTDEGVTGLGEGV